MDKEIEEMCRESFEMLDCGDVDGALRLSGEALAISDSRLARVSAGIDLGADAALLHACVVHTSIMLATGMASDAFSCCVMTACIADSRGNFAEADLAGECAGLLHCMILSAMAAVDTVAPGNNVRKNAEELIGLAGRLYIGCAGNSGDRDETFDMMLGRFCTPAGTAKIDGKEVPVSYTKAFLAEIVRLGADLGILQV